MDKVPYTKRDGFTGIYVHLLPTGRRHLVAVLRTADLCNCGCSHWCSMYPIYIAIAWSLRSLVDGVFPDKRHDAMPWRDTDAERASKAGMVGQRAGCQCAFCG
eukprot:1641019-Pyramimonas_sp.AAC.2